MRRTSLATAAAVVLLANAFALVHAWRNRSGAAESDVTLTEREISGFYTTTNEDSGVTLILHWTDPHRPYFSPDSSPPPWLDQNILRELGFDTSVAASDHAAFEYYSRQRPRRAFVALEYDGPAWRKWIDDTERQAREKPPPPYLNPANQREESSRLVAIDASSDAATLRARHPDRSSVVVVPAVVRIELAGKNPQTPAYLYGSIQELPSEVHVPLPFSEAFRHPPAGRSVAKYRVHLRYGALLEPWIVGVDFSDLNTGEPKRQP